MYKNIQYIQYIQKQFYTILQLKHSNKRIVVIFRLCGTITLREDPSDHSLSVYTKRFDFEISYTIRKPAKSYGQARTFSFFSKNPIK